MRKKKGTRILAIIMAAVMTLMSVDLSAFAVNLNDEENNALLSSASETTDLYEESLLETTESAEDGNSVETSAALDGAEETSAEIEFESESGKEIEEETESMDALIEEETESMDALFTVSWMDESNLAERRPEDIRELVDLYADGVAQDIYQYTCTLLNEDMDGNGEADPDLSYGLETYYYVISGLPVYADGDRQTKIHYTIKEDREKIKGYTAVNQAFLDEFSSMMDDRILTPDDRMTLNPYDGADRKTESRFVNYLPAYSMSGSIHWNSETMSASDALSIEAYFAEHFIVTCHGEKYTNYTVDWREDENNVNIWHYSVDGLFTTDREGENVFYEVKPDAFEGIEVKPASMAVDENTDNAVFTYQLNHIASPRYTAKAEDKQDSKPAEYQYNGKAQAKVIWYDTTTSAVFEHGGDLTLVMTYTYNNEKYRIEDFAWDSEKECYYHVYTTDEAERLGVQKGGRLEISNTGENSLNRTLTADKLTTSVKTYDENGGSTEIEVKDWEIEVTGVGDKVKPGNIEGASGYSACKDEDNTYIMYPLMDILIDMDIRSGLDPLTGDWQSKYLQYFGLYFNDGSTFGGTENYDIDKLREYFKNSYNINEFDITRSADDSGKNVKIHIKGVPYFNKDKKVINYWMQSQTDLIDVTEEGTGSSDEITMTDGYRIEYDNTNVPGHGTDLSAAYAGGKIILTRTGTKRYTAYKFWQDEFDKIDTENRPKAKWTLWRYSRNNSGNYQTAAGIFYDDAGNLLEVQYTGYDKHGNDITKDLPENLSDSMNVKDWHTHGYAVEQFVIENLPAYDPDGYRYIYFAREGTVSDSDYQRFYGSRADEGYFSGEDVLPVRYKYNFGTEERREDDTSLYNGGALSNRKEKYISVSATKTWKAAYYQDDLSNVEVELTLEAKHKNPNPQSYGESDHYEKDDWYKVKDNEGKEVKLLLSGFDAYHLSRTGSVDVNEYCENGHLLEFRWVETKIYETVEGQSEKKEIEPYTIGRETRFRLTVNENTKNAESYEHGDEYFISETSGEKIEDGKPFVITNTLKGQTEYFVRKLWQESSEPGPIVVTLEQYNASGARVQMIKKELKKDTEVSKTNPDKAYGGNYESKDSGWIHLFEDLPKYDENGNFYTYVVKEQEDNGKYISDYDFGFDVDNDQAVEKNSVQITNSGPGVVRYIALRKIWLDDSETKDRRECEFSVYTEDAVLLYGTIGGAEGFLSKDFVAISDNSSWWRKVNVTLFKTEVEGKTILLRRENSADGGTSYIDIDGNSYLNWKEIPGWEKYADEKEWQEANLYDGGFCIYEYSADSNPVDAGTVSALNYPTVKSGDSCYEVLYHHKNIDGNFDVLECTNAPDEEGYYSVVNRRTGILNYEVTKKWQDGMATPEERAKWQAALTISSDEWEDHVIDNSDGKGYVELPLRDMRDAGGTLDAAYGILKYEKDFRQPIQDVDGNQVSKNQKLTGEADDASIETVVFKNLPMYDALGKIVHYSVKEEIDQDSNYVVSYDDIEYKDNTPEESDIWTAYVGQTITNTRQKTDTYNWYLLWLDEYRKENEQRPDIYLNLYYTSYEYDENGKLLLDDKGEPKYIIERYPDFKEYLWNENVADVKESSWEASFELPKYDEYGTEIRYFANQTTGIGYSALDYIRGQYANGWVKKLEDFQKAGVNTSTVEYDETAGKYVTVHDDENAIVGSIVSGDGQKTYMLEAGNSFVNQLKEDITIQGRKIWEKIPEGFPVDDLPPLTFRLYRLKMNDKGEYLLADDSTTKVYDEKGICTVNDSGTELTVISKDGTEISYQVELVSAIENMLSPGTEYTFSMARVGFNDKSGASIPDEENHWEGTKAEEYGSPLSKYHPSGSMYKYTIVETISEEADASKVEDAYEQLSGTVNGYNIKNTFDTLKNVSSISLKKAWTDNYDNFEIETYPETTYKLYRFYQYKNEGIIGDKGKNYSDVKLIEEKTLSSTDAKAGKGVDFGEQLVYAPNLTPYIYFIVETPVEGYGPAQFKLTPGETVTAEAGLTGWPSAENNASAYPDMCTDNGWASQAFKLLDDKEDKADVTVEIENTYTGMPRAELSGSKEWLDYDNDFETRPTELKLVLGRFGYDGGEERLGVFTLSVTRNPDGTETNPHISFDPEETTDGTTDWPKGNNVTGDITSSIELEGNKWKYTVSGLDGYMTTGEAYRYFLKEDPVPEHYICNADKIESKSDELQDDRRVITMKDLINDSWTKMTVKKDWSTLNSALILPDVQIELQVWAEDIDGTEKWHWAKEYFEDKENEDLKNYGYVQTLNHSNGWQHTYGNLPEYYSSGDAYKEFKYRAVEIQIGDTKVEFGDGREMRPDAVSTEMSGSQTVSYEMTISSPDGITNGDFTVKNSVDSTQITVTKQWVNDHQNVYDTRGDADDDNTTEWSIGYHVYRSYQPHDGSAAVPEPVKNADGSEYILYISGSNTSDSGSAMVTGLPAKAPSGDVYTYSVVELNPNGTEITDISAQKYNGSYGVKEQSEQSPDSSAYTAAFTNTLQTTKIDVTKEWADDLPEMRNKDDFRDALVLYRYPEGGLPEQAEQVDYEDILDIHGEKTDNKWTFTLENLPKYNPSGILYHYEFREEQLPGYELPVYETQCNDEHCGELMINTGIQFAMDKVSSENINEHLNNVSLTFEATVNERKVRLIWSRDAQGAESYEISYSGNGADFTKWTEGKARTGSVQIIGLPAGTYNFVSETKIPNGYIRPTLTNVSFTVNKNGTITAKGDCLSVSDDQLKLTVKDTPEEIMLEKKGKESDGTFAELTSGYSFKVTGDFRKTDSETESGTRYIGAVPDGETLLDKGMLLVSVNVAVPEHIYQLEEVTAPAGYKRSKAIVTFWLDVSGNVHIQAVAADGVPVANTQWSDYASTEGHIIVFLDEPLELGLVKNGTDGVKNSGGAEFLLEQYLADGGDDPWTEVERVTTKAGQILKFNSAKLNVGGVYRLTEIKAPNGYILPSAVDSDGNVTAYTGTYIFKLNDNGEAVRGSIENNVFKPDDQNPGAESTLTVTDAPIQVSIHKTDAKDGRELSGVAFELYQVIYGEKNGGTADVETPVDGIGVITTDDTGKAMIPAGKLIAGQTYRLYEKNYTGYVDEPDGKELVYEFKICPDGTAIEVGECPLGEVSETDKTVIELKNNELQGRLTVTKVDTADLTKVLEGAEFILYKSALDENGILTKGEKVQGPAATDSNGTVLFDNLAWGTYVLEETKAPDGYERASELNEVTIGRSGTDIELILGVTVKNKENEISFQKYAEGGSDALSGAIFELTGRMVTNDVTGQDAAFEAQSIDGGIRWTSVANKPFILKGRLIAGITYELREVKAPAGYKLNPETYTFTMKEDGTIAWKGNTPADAALEDDNKAISVYDRPITISLEKQDNTGNLLDGAEFSLKVLDADNNWRRVVAENLVTDPKGEIKLQAEDGTSLITSGSQYMLTEEKAPEGYITRIPALSVQFTADVDGTVILPQSHDAGISLNDSRDRIIVKNMETAIFIQKLDSETDAPIPGAELAIYKKSDFVVDDDGVPIKPNSGAVPEAECISAREAINLEGLAEEEDYILYETKAPSGYDSFAPLEFRLEKGNIVGLTGSDRSDAQVQRTDDRGYYTIFIEDRRIRGHVKLTKFVDSDGDGKGDEALKGVEFALYRVGFDEPIAEDLTVDADGKWCSKNNIKDTFVDLDGEKKNFADGLPTGEYYFLETKATAATALNTEKHSFIIGDSDTGAHGKTAEVTVLNESYAAAVALKKLDEENGEGIRGVSFELSGIPEGGTEADRVTLEGTTDSNGCLTFEGLVKGNYRLTEISADGYDIAQVGNKEHLPFIGEFVLGENENGRRIQINRGAVAEDAETKVTVVQGTLSEKGITNPRLYGSVVLYKADGENVSKALSNVEFTLYRQNESTGLWETVRSFLTGKSYSAVDNWAGTTLDVEGKLIIHDLDWGTYKLVETKSADGYSITDKETGRALETAEFTFDRESSKLIELSTDGESFSNYRTALRIKKKAEDGAVLNGAQFVLKGSFVNEDGAVKAGTLNLTTDSQGLIELKGVLAAGQTYLLEETSAPNGYERLNETLEFMVETDGRVTVIKKAAGYELTKSEYFDNQLEVTNKKQKPINNAVQTGDTAPVVRLLALMLAALLVLILLFRRKSVKTV